MKVRNGIGDDGDGGDEEFAVPAGLGDPTSWPTGTLLAMAGRLVERAWNRRLAELGITASGVAILFALAQGPRGQAELAAAVRMSEQAMGRGIDRLEGHGFVERRRHPSDRRRSLVSATTAGREALRMSLYGRPGEASVFDQLADHQRLRADLLALITLLDTAKSGAPETDDASAR
jgi:DNA-binding MarR family transcriptional regulator